MRIAVIGWGSLIWCPGSLLVKGRWHRDGPKLPIEFARISDDGRLTLVILPGTEEQPTYWAISELDNIDEAMGNLQEREATPQIERIHCIEANGKSRGEIEPKIKDRVAEWLKGKQPGVGAVIWTGLESNWEKKRPPEFSPGDAVKYLRELEARSEEAAATLRRAREYLKNTPDNIQTEVRRRMSSDENWKDAQLSAALFEE